MKIITLASAKGGVGKSASSISIAYVLSQLNYKVLLIDLDPQNAVTRHFVSNPETIKHTTIRQIILNNVFSSDCFISTYDNVDLIPSQLSLLNIEKELADANNPVFRLYEVLSTLNTSYEFCIIDTPPWMGLMTKSALICSNVVVIPTILEKWPVEAIEILLTEIQKAKQTQKYIDKSIERVYLLPTFFEERIIVLKSYLQALKEDYPQYVTNNLIHKSVEIGKTYSIEKSSLDQKSRAYSEYLSIVEEIILNGKEI